MLSGALEITIPYNRLIAFTYIVIRIGHATYRYADPQKRSGGMFSSRSRNCRYGIASHFQPCLYTTHSEPGSVGYALVCKIVRTSFNHIHKNERLAINKIHKANINVHPPVVRPWNSLPLNLGLSGLTIVELSRLLKTHLFC